MEDNILINSVPAVDYPKSVTKQRLVYKMTGGDIFMSVFSYIFIFFWLFLGSAPLAAAIRGNTIPIWLTLCSFVFFCWMLSNIIFRNAFAKAEAKNKEENRKNMSIVLNNYYDDLDFQIDNENILRSVKPTGRPIWGRVITVIFDDRTIYLNITTLSKGQTPAFLFGFSNFLKARRIVKNFKSQYL